MTCSACGAPLVEGARFCASCGQPLQRRADERRVVTVLFADLVGFTSLSETRDPEQVKNLVDDCFELLVADISAFGGQVDKIVGDAILALFGAPTAHEDDAERAVRAALRMQRSIGDWASNTGADALRVRIGINTGEVLTGALRAGGDYTAMGDVVNTTQRLQTAAQPGQVVVGATTHAATRHVLRYTALGAVRAKGREELVEAWVAEEAMLPPGARPGRGATPLVGRDHELNLVSGAVTNACKRHRAQMVLVMAEAGMGKSRLAEEAAAVAECSHGVTVLEGRCVPYGEANVWWPVAEALRSTCEVGLGAPLEVAREQVTARVRAGMADATQAEIERVTKGLLHVMGYEGSLSGIDPTRAREEVVRSLLEFIEGWAKQRPVVVLLSDLHWADDVVLELGDTILERLAALPVVLICTARHGLFERWQPRVGRHNTLVLNLDSLDREASAELLDAMVEGPLPDDLRTLLLDRSGGNPFFLEELVALVAETGVSALDRPPGAPPRLAGALGVELPYTLRGLVAARLDALTADERGVLEDAAVLGRRGEVAALAIMGEHTHDTIDVHGAVGGLVDKDVLVVGDDAWWSFRSDLVREVAYGMLTKADRAKRHLGVARWMEAHSAASPGDVDRIAHHYATSAVLVLELGGHDLVDTAELVDKAAEWLDRAITGAEGAELYVVVAHLADHALVLGDALDETQKLRFLLARARALVAQRELVRAGADLVTASAAAIEVGGTARAEVLLVRGDLEQKSGDLGASRATLAEALDGYRAAGDERGVGDALRSLGLTEMFSDRGEDAQGAFAEALALSRRLGDRRGEAWALQHLAWLSYTSGDVVSAEAWCNGSIEAFREIGDAGGLGWAMGLLSFVRYHQGRFDEAEAIAVPLVDEAAQRGDRWAEGMMRNLLGLLALWTGRTNEAVEHGQVALSRFTDMGDWYGLLLAVGVLGRSLVASGRVEEGFAVINGASVSTAALNVSTATEMLSAHLAGAAAQAGMPERSPARPGTTDFERVLQIGWVDREVALALLALQCGEADTGRDILERVAVGDHAVGFGGAALALARAAAGDLDGAVDAAMVVGAGDHATYSDRVLALIGGGLALAAQGEADRSGAMLRTAQELADSTDDALVRATVRLAVARAGERLGRDASDELRRAQLTFAAMGIGATGWDTAFRLVLDP
ncbi:MAG: ATP-binding protein [Acidimicrobiales bacterium]